MKKSGITRRNFIVGSATGAASLLVGSYHRFDAWAAKEEFPLNIAVEFTDHAASAYVAKQKGWFEEEGLKPVFYNYVTGMSLAAALSKGNIQAAYMCLLPAINAYANAGVPVRIVAGLHRHGYGLVVNPEKVKSVKDLEKPGIRIGCVQVGGPVDAVLIKTIEKYGLDRSKVLGKVQRMNPPMQILAIKTGKLDASFSPEHWPAMGEDAGFSLLLRSRDVWPGMQGSVLIVREDLIKNHPEVVKKLVEITGKSTRWMGENPEEAASIMAGQLRVTGDRIFPTEAAEAAAKLAITPKTVRRSMERLEYALHVDTPAVQDAIDFAAREGNIRKAFNANDVLDLRFVDEKKI
ncbi:MAG: ABC transporter substrate-binding protein [Pseudomonadota bacterium]